MRTQRPDVLAWTCLLAGTMVQATDTRAPHIGPPNVARSLEPPDGRPGQVVALVPREGIPTPLTVRDELAALLDQARGAALQIQPVAWFDAERRMRAYVAG